MALDRNKLEDLMRQLPEELQGAVLEFAESLLQKKRIDSDSPGGDESPSMRVFFGIWDSGDQHSADNDRIDADLAREYASFHQKD